MKKIILIVLVALSVFVLSACSGRGIVNNWPGLSADADRAYISNGSHIYAVDLQTGEEVWRYPSEVDSKLVFFANPILTEDGQLLIGSEGATHSFVSINAQTGKDNWVEPFAGAKGAWVASPLVVNGRIYVPNTDGYLYILDMEGKQAADKIQIGGSLWSAPVTDGSFLYISSLDHHFHVIDSVRGEVVQTVDLGGAIPSSGAVSSDGVYIGSFAQKIEFVSSDGEHKTIAETANWIWGTPTLDNETLFYADLDGNIFSLDLKTGKQNWNELKPDGPVVASLLVHNEQIYAATEEGSLYAFDRAGNIVWEKDTKGKMYTTPIAAGDLILAAPYLTETGVLLIAYDAEGKQAWTFTPEEK